MKIRFRQSGGFAGLVKVAEVDSGEVAGEEVGRLESMVREALAQAVPENTSAMPDDEQVYIEIEIEQRRETILVGRSQVPGPMRPLVEFLEQRARHEKRKPG